jgi:hypothetical protein
MAQQMPYVPHLCQTQTVAYVAPLCLTPIQFYVSAVCLTPVPSSDLPHWGQAPYLNVP